MINRPDVIKAALSVGITDFDRARIGYDKMNVYEREIWNEAIEAAAKVIEKYDHGAAYEIRRLKIMSVKKLVIHTKNNVDTIELEMIEDATGLYLLTINGQGTLLDRISVDMIRLYLQEHLK